MDPFSLKKILHPTDFSAPAEAALVYALDLALRTGAALRLLHVVGGPTLTAQAEEDLMVRLRETANAHFGVFDHAALAALDIDYELAEGRHAAPVIVERAARHEAGVVVLGTHGRRGLRHFLLGSVAEAVVREAASAVLVVRERQAAEPVAVSRILVPVDFSEHTGPSLAQARHLAAHYGATLSLLFVAEEHVVPFFSDTGIPTFTLMKIDPGIVAHAGEALRQLDARTPGPDVPVAYLVRSGQPASEIVAVAKEQQAGLIVMAPWGLRGVERRLLGSVTERVMRTAPCPVWTVQHAAGEAPP